MNHPFDAPQIAEGPKLHQFGDRSLQYRVDFESGQGFLGLFRPFLFEQGTAGNNDVLPFFLNLHDPELILCVHVLFRSFAVPEIDLADRAEGTKAGDVYVKTSLIHGSDPSLDRNLILSRVPKDIDGLGSLNLDPLGKVDSIPCRGDPHLDPVTLFDRQVSLLVQKFFSPGYAFALAPQIDEDRILTNLYNPSGYSFSRGKPAILCLGDRFKEFGKTFSFFHLSFGHSVFTSIIFILAPGSRSARSRK